MNFKKFLAITYLPMFVVMIVFMFLPSYYQGYSFYPDIIWIVLMIHIKLKPEKKRIYFFTVISYLLSYFISLLLIQSLQTEAFVASLIFNFFVIIATSITVYFLKDDFNRVFEGKSYNLEELTEIMSNEDAVTNEYFNQNALKCGDDYEAFREYVFKNIWPKLITDKNPTKKRIYEGESLSIDEFASCMFLKESKEQCSYVTPYNLNLFDYNSYRKKIKRELWSKLPKSPKEKETTHIKLHEFIAMPSLVDKKRIVLFATSIMSVTLTISIVFLGIAYVKKTTEIENLKNDIIASDKEFEEYKDDYYGISYQYDILKKDYDRIKDENVFYSSYIVFCDDASIYYHKYDCNIWDRNYFYAFNKEGAEHQGYYPCPNCF